MSSKMVVLITKYLFKQLNKVPVRSHLDLRISPQVTAPVLLTAFLQAAGKKCLHPFYGYKSRPMSLSPMEWPFLRPAAALP